VSDDELVMRNRPIGPYPYPPPAPAYHEYDPRYPEVARVLAEMIAGRIADVVVEHIGSTSVPGLPGKGYIDSQVLYPEGRLQAVKDALEDLGFGRQRSRDPWPEERPMRTGSLVYDGTVFLIHAHVIREDAPEVAELRAFRDRLRTEAVLRAAYAARKREIIASGVADSLEYTHAKSDFVRRALGLG
jgi:GrpB-like predicted nucleotidyltransferase (UPF0157 family)